MKICIAQTRPVKGDIAANILHHTAFIQLALANAADMIVFPELSITGYEPALAAELAMDAGDSRFNELQEISNTQGLTIAFGLPTHNAGGVSISLLILQTGQPRQLYSKKYLHPDEYPFFVSGQNFPVITGTNPLVSLAICYELSIPEHSANAAASGAAIYIASVAKTAAGMEKAGETLAAIAARYSMTVLLCNSIGPSDNFESGGKSAAWNSKGTLLAQLDDSNEGIMVFDTAEQEVVVQRLIKQGHTENKGRADN